MGLFESFIQFLRSLFGGTNKSSPPEEEEPTSPEPEEPSPPEEEEPTSPEPEEPSPPEEEEPTPTPTEPDSPDDDINIRWPPRNCVTAESLDDGEQTIEVVIHYGEGYKKAGRVAVAYADYALSEAFGDKYVVDVKLGKPAPLSVKTRGEMVEWIKNSDAERGDDCTHIVTLTSDLVGGARSNTSISPVGAIENLDPNCVIKVGGGDAHYDMGNVLHEIGHTLGMNHNHTASNGPAPPMATGYVPANYWIHEYTDRAIRESEYNG